MTPDAQNARWIVGYYTDDENTLNFAYIYPSKERALREFSFEPDGECEMGTVFLAKIIQRQERKHVNKTFVKTIDVESGKTLSETEYSIAETDD